ALQHSIDLEDEAALTELLRHTEIGLKQTEDGQRVEMDQQDVTLEIRSHDVTNSVSYVAKHPPVREIMVKRQQDLAVSHGVVMDGRDIGTHVLPQAELKIFLIASVEERALRRHKENLEKGFASDLEEL